MTSRSWRRRGERALSIKNKALRDSSGTGYRIPNMIGPLFNIEVAITLQDPTGVDSKKFPANREPMTLKQALEAVTIGSAWQIRMEDKIGTIEAGKYTDLVNLEKNFFNVKP